jgi:SulP family sulfate permease
MSAEDSSIRRESLAACKSGAEVFPPIRSALRGYNAAKAFADLKAGMNVALLAFPQSMAYAVVAGLPVFYGIFTEIVAGIVAPLVSGSRFIIAGATNATAVLFFATVASLGLSPGETLGMVPLLLFLVGVFILLGALAGVANFIQFVSRSVIVGYITAAAIYIIVNQLGKALGLEMHGGGASVFAKGWATLAALPTAHVPTLVLSFATAALYWLLERHRPGWPNVALVLVAMSALGALMNVALAPVLAESGPIRHMDAISLASWKWHAPTFSVTSVTLLFETALVLAFLCTLEAVSVGKSVAARAGEKLDVTHELSGIGAANIASSCLGGMPVSGSPVRSQLSWSSGANTPLAHVFSSLFVGAALLALGPLVRFIPVSALATLIVFIGFSLINRHVLRVVFKSTRGDAAVFAVTFLAALVLRLDIAIVIGTALSIVLFLRKAAVPQLVEYGATESGTLAPIETPQPSDGRQTIAVMHVEGDLFFGAAELFRDQMRRICEDKGLKIIILKLRNAHHLDATSILALEELIHYMKEQNRTLMVSEAGAETMRIFESSGLDRVVGRENIFPDNLQNPTLPTARALRRAKEILKTRDAHISIVLGVQKRADKPALRP